MYVERDDMAAQRQRWDTLRRVLAAQRQGPPLAPRPAGAATPASFAQRRFWFLDRVEPGTPAHTLTVAHRITGSLACDVLGRAFGEVIRRHEALRTTLAEVEGGELFQIIDPPRPFTLPCIDLSTLPADARNAALQKHEAVEAACPFELRSGPLLRALILKLDEGDYQLLVSVHHAVFDGWSFEILMDELGKIYGAYVAGAPSPLAEPVLHYADAALWERQRLQGETLEHLRDYWKTRLAGAPPVLAVPSDRLRHPGRDRRGASRTRPLPADLAVGLKHLADDAGATLFAVLLTGFQILLHRHTGETDIVVGTPVANRHRGELSGMIGAFVNTLPLRLAVTGKSTVRALVASAAETINGALAHQDLPFELIVEAVNPPRLTDYAPLAQVLFAFQNVPRRGWGLPGMEIRSWQTDSRCVTHDLVLYTQETPAGLTAALHYDSSLFDAATAEALLDRYAVILAAMAAAPNTEVAALPIISSAEKARLEAFNDTRAPYPDRSSIHELFAARACASPDAIAVVGAGGTLSYAELNGRANRLARRLHGLSLGPEPRIGLRTASDVDRIVALLAILKVGGAYVPLDAVLPPAQAAQRLSDVSARLVLTDQALPRALTAAVEASGISILDLSASAQAITRESAADFGLETGPEHLACVLFTSGSTGGAKAVAVTHRGVVRLAYGLGEATPQACDVLLHLAPLDFDAATFEIWAALLNGARVVAFPGGASTGDALGAMIRGHCITMMWLTAGLFEVIVDTRAEALQPLRRLLVGGDIVSPAHAARFLARAPDCRLFNGYGPTEATTFTSLHPITAAELDAGGPIPIGRPIANTRMYVLDDAGCLVPIGVPGEAWIGGDGIARGYLNDPALTRQRFIADPFENAPSARLYRSGDRVRQRHDGAFEFLGRIDTQVKIRGIRVEMGAVEEALLRCPSVAQAAVRVIGDGAAGKQIAAWIVPTPGANPREGLREHLRRLLPEAMIPSSLEVVDSLPLTSSGKVDSAALPPPGAGLSSHDPPEQNGVRVLPRDTVEGTLLALFEDLLQMCPLSIHDGFFESGGDSLLSIQLVHQIEESFGISLPLLSVFEAHTVAHLAEIVRALPHRLSEHDSPSLITVRRGDPANPVFLIPGGHGGMVEMALYARLLRRMEGNRMVYGLRLGGMDGSVRLPSSAGAMAAAHLKIVRTIQPSGPYRLIGECVGAGLAFEMARQLKEQGEAVDDLILLDGWCPSAAGQRRYEWVERPNAIWQAKKSALRLAAAELSAVYHDHRRAFLAQGWRQRRHQFGDAIGALWRVTRRWLPSMVRFAWPQPGQTAAAERSYVRTLMGHRPRHYTGPVTVIASEESLKQGIAEGWRRWVTGGITIRGVPGDHDSYLNDHVDATLAAIAACLQHGPHGRAHDRG